MTQTNQINKTNYNSPEYKRSRKAYIAQCTFEYFISLLVADAFLAKVLTDIGMSDFLVGIISSFISLSFVFQLLSIFVVRVRISTKRLVIIADTISQLFFTMIYIIPFVPVAANAKKVLLIFAILIAYALKYLILSLCFKWANSYVDPSHRAVYSANKEIISLVTGIVFTSVMGAIIDKFEGIGNLHGAFLFIAISMLILNICNFISLMMIKKEDKKEHAADNVPLRVVMKHTLYNKNFRNVIIMTCLWDFAKFFSVGFMGVYKTKDLMMSVFSVQMINMVANGFRVLVSRAFGRFSDKYSYARGMELALCIAALGFLFNTFSTPKHWYFIILYTIFHYCSTAGLNQNSFNIAYSYVPLEYVPQAMAFKNSIGGIFGFSAALLGESCLTLFRQMETPSLASVFTGSSFFQVYHLFLPWQQYFSFIL